jgi:anti-anti-sigma factor
VFVSTNGLPFTIRIEHPPGFHVIRLAGEFDLSGRDALNSALSQVGDGRVILDIDGLTFIDSQGLQELVRAAITRGIEMTPGIGQPAQLLKLTGLDRRLQVFRGSREGLTA